MQKHTKIFQDFWNDCNTLSQSYQCFMCGKWNAVDIHHVQPKQMGGSKCKDNIENLAALCRMCHDRCHQSKYFNKLVRIKTLRRVADQLERETQ
jgi:hypothetical protein